MKLTLVEKQNQTPQADKTVWCVTFKYQEEAHYQPGDWLTLKVSNSPVLIAEIKQKLGLTGQERVTLRRVGEVSVDEALTNHLEISQLNPAILNKLQRQYFDYLDGYSWTDRQQMMEYAYGRDILDLLNAFPKLSSLKTELLTLLSPLAPRYYSIASCETVHPQQVRLLIRQVVYETHHRIHYGVASNYIALMKLGEQIEGDFLSNRNFKLPESSETPIIMIAAGVGLAPFLGFLEAREQQKQAGQTVGENWLFFGETHQETTFLCRSELDAWQQQGLLKLTTAFSRDGEEKAYVQHRLLEAGEAVYQQLQAGAVMYVCGSKDKLAPAIEKSLQQILQQYAGLSEEASVERVQQLKQTQQLQMDVY